MACLRISNELALSAIFVIAISTIIITFSYMNSDILRLLYSNKTYIGDTASNTTEVKNEARSADVKVVLYWNSYFGKDDYYFGLGPRAFFDAGCPVHRCLTTADRNLEAKSDAIIIHINKINLNNLPNLSRRTNNQRWIFYRQETPIHTKVDLKALKGLFNWTMSYRTDSDIFNPYGKVLPKMSTNTSSFGSYNSGKTKRTNLIAWMVGHCNTSGKREDYVDELQKYIPVDIYGNCNKKFCNKICETKLFQSYKFYLAFENSLCQDYVTEKLYRVLRHDVVPIVYGGANYSLFAPPRSVIDVRDFESPLQLAKYLLYLDANETAYNEYFEWKMNFEAVLQTKPYFCDICRKLHEDDTVQVYDDIERWWKYGGSNREQCTKGPLIT